MNKWIISLVTAAIVTAVAYFVRLELFGEKTITAHYTISVTNEKNAQPVASILSSRLEGTDFIFNDPALSKSKPYELQFDVQLQQVKDTQLLHILLGSKGSLQFWETYDYAELQSLENAIKEAIDSLYIEKKEKKASTNDSSLVALMEQPDPASATGIYNKLFAEGIVNGLVIAIKDTAETGIIIRHPLVKAALPADAFFCYGHAYTKQSENLNLYIIRTRGREKSFLDNSHIKNASLEFDLDGRPMVAIQFTNQGAVTWEKFTENNVHKIVAMTMDSFVLSAPQVSEKISGGKMNLSGAYSTREAGAMASLVSIIPLPSKVAITNCQVKSNKSASLSGRRLLILPFVFAIVFALCLICLNFLASKPQKPAPEA